MGDSAWVNFAGVGIGWALGFGSNLLRDWWTKRGFVAVSVAEAWVRDPSRHFGGDSDDLPQVQADLTLRLQNAYSDTQHVEIASVRYLDKFGAYICNDPTARLSYEGGDPQPALELLPRSFTRVMVQTLSATVETEPEEYDSAAMNAMAIRVAAIEVVFLVLPDVQITKTIKLENMKGMLDPAHWQERRRKPFRVN